MHLTFILLSSIKADDFVVEAVEKVDFDRILRHGEKYDLSGCSVCDDLMLGKC